MYYVLFPYSHQKCTDHPPQYERAPDVKNKGFGSRKLRANRNKWGGVGISPTVVHVSYIERMARIPSVVGIPMMGVEKVERMELVRTV